MLSVFRPCQSRQQESCSRLSPLPHSFPLKTASDAKLAAAKASNKKVDPEHASSRVARCMMLNQQLFGDVARLSHSPQRGLSQ